MGVLLYSINSLYIKSVKNLGAYDEGKRFR